MKARGAMLVIPSALCDEAILPYERCRLVRALYLPLLTAVPARSKVAVGGELPQRRSRGAASRPLTGVQMKPTDSQHRSVITIIFVARSLFVLNMVSSGM